MLLLPDALARCFGQMPLPDAPTARCFYCQMPLLPDAPARCSYCQMPSPDTPCRCSYHMPTSDVLARCFDQMPPPDAPARCSYCQMLKSTAKCPRQMLLLPDAQN